MPQRSITPDWWDEATRHLSKRDKVLAKLIRHPREPDFQVRGDAFQTLARSIVGQQISVAAAASIWGRFATLVRQVKPANVLAVSAEDLRACGFSGQKAAYVQDLARRFHEGEVKPRRWPRMDDEAIIEELVQVKASAAGRWRCT